MYDLVIIGAGAAGIEASKRAIKSGLKTLLVDKNFDNFGGTCLNFGCIPTKYYLNSSKFNKDLSLIYNEKNEIVNSIKDSARDFLEKGGLEFKCGEVKFVSSNKIKIDETKVEAKNIIIATGSKPHELVKVDGEKIIFAENLFLLQSLPESFLIIGASYVGLEMACILNNLGKKVLVIEKEDSILPRVEKSLTSRLKVILKKRGIEIKTSDDFGNYNFDDYQMVIQAVGRQPNVDDLNLADIGLKQKEGSWIDVDNKLCTNVSNIYACGDVCGDKMLAYTAEEQARIIIDNINGQDRQEDFFGLAQCVFTQPQIACVGVLSVEAREKNIEHKVIKSNFLRFSSAHVYSDTNGYIEVAIDSNNKIIGAGIISNIASELISVFSLAIRSHLTSDDLKNCTFIHPTISEIVSSIFKD